MRKGLPRRYPSTRLRACALSISVMPSKFATKRSSASSSLARAPSAIIKSVARGDNGLDARTLRRTIVIVRSCDPHQQCGQRKPRIGFGKRLRGGRREAVQEISKHKLNLEAVSAITIGPAHFCAQQRCLHCSSLMPFRSQATAPLRHHRAGRPPLPPPTSHRPVLCGRHRRPLRARFR